MNIILCTMVKNESKALPRLINSCKGIVSHVVISDTGSTDDTVEVAKKICDEIGVPYEIHQDTWSDFGKNRTNNLVHGHLSVSKWGLKPEDSYLLLLDADMEVPTGVSIPKVFPPITLLPQYDKNYTWWNVRIIRCDIEASYIGRTHEYISHKEPALKYDWFTIIDHCDGGCRSDKFERDERLLRLDLKDNPDNGRSMFYLAQTLQNLHRFNEAIELYDRRVKIGGFIEECWMSMWEASQCCFALNKVEEANERALAAYAYRPQRAEPLAAVASRCADMGQHHRAMMLAREGMKIPFPIGESLYCGKGPYTWDFHYSIMISAYYIGSMEEGREACEFLHLTPGSPGSYVALCNSVHYAKPIEGDRIPIPIVLDQGWNPASPCFCKHDNGWIALIRTVNYTITPDGRFVIPGDKVKTITLIAHLDQRYQISGTSVPLINPPSTNPAAMITGFEDQRIVRIEGNEIILAGVRCDASPISQPELWESRWKITTGECLDCRKLSKGESIEKNWLPYADGGYLYNHSSVGAIFTDKDGTIVRVEQVPHLAVSSFRGSAAPIPYKHGQLYVIHEVAARGRRTYIHRLCFVPKNDWSKLKVSRPFLLKGTPCMESCFSIQPIDGGIVMSCAYEDKEIYAIEVKHDTIKEMLR